MSNPKMSLGEQFPIPSRDSKVELSISTIGDYGSVLPTGILHEGKLHKNFTLREFSMKEERALGEIRKKAAKGGTFDFMCSIFQHMLLSLGPYTDFQAIDYNIRKSIIGSMFNGDVMYMYVYMRRQAMGPEFVSPVECASCSHKWREKSDLDGIPVHVIDDVAKACEVHTFETGIEMKKGERVKDVIVQPARFSALSSVGKNSTMSDARFSQASVAIRPLEEGAVITPAMLETMTKRDFEIVTKKIDDLSPGMELVYEINCPACGAERFHSLKYDWDFFFSASSL